jgi:hypothetical protein
VSVPAGVVAVYDKVAKNLTCVASTDKASVAPVPVSAAAPSVPEPVPVEKPGVVVAVAGASARREYERRKINDERHIAEWCRVGHRRSHRAVPARGISARAL